MIEHENRLFQQHRVTGVLNLDELGPWPTGQPRPSTS
jgi:hypothetical protein